MQNLTIFLVILITTPFILTENIIQLAVDTNRDGQVDFIADDLYEDSWNLESGAIFLYNNDCDGDNTTPDCFDTIVNGVNDIEDFALILLQKIPDLSQTAQVTISIDTDSQNKVNMFMKINNSYLFIDRYPFTVSSDLLQQNVTFLLEAKSYADKSWSGLTKITATITDENTQQSDTVQLKVAPFILLPNTQEVETIYIREYPGKNDTMIEQLKSIIAKTNVNLQIVPANLYPYYQIWMQDTMEIGYSQTPTHWLNVVFPANRNRPLDNWAKTGLLGKDFGWFRYSDYRHEFARGGGENGWLDWYGNLEVSPAFPGYPLGRIYYGHNGVHSLNPEIVEMLNEQKVQGPAVALDTGWLLIKHVDEIISFIPGKDQKSFKVMLPSTTLTIDLLKKWQKEGKGRLKILERNNQNWTIDSLLANKSLMDYNIKLQRRIDNIYSVVQKEFSITEEQIILIPALLSSGESLIPNMVNSVYMNGNILMAAPNGPKENNIDLIEEYVKSIMSDLPIQVHFLDDWKYHTWAGNVHCATNTKRKKLDANWWD